MNLGEQLKRDGHLLNRPHKSGPKPKRFLKRTVRPRQVSSKRAKEGRVYSVKRKAFLESHPKCEVLFSFPNSVVSLWALPICDGASRDVHHRARRLGGNYLKESTWIAVCRTCHDWIHTHPKEARALGLLA